MQSQTPIFQAPLPTIQISERQKTSEASFIRRGAWAMTVLPSPKGIAILEAAAVYRGLTAEQISRLLFPPTETRNKQGEVVLTSRDTDKTKVSRQAYNHIRK